jgi:hypothetical protein
MRIDIVAIHHPARIVGAQVCGTAGGRLVARCSQPRTRVLDGHPAHFSASIGRDEATGDLVDATAVTRHAEDHAQEIPLNSACPWTHAFHNGRKDAVSGRNTACTPTAVRVTLPTVRHVGSDRLPSLA